MRTIKNYVSLLVILALLAFVPACVSTDAPAEGTTFKARITATGFTEPQEKITAVSPMEEVTTCSFVSETEAPVDKTTAIKSETEKDKYSSIKNALVQSFSRPTEYSSAVKTNPTTVSSTGTQRSSTAKEITTISAKEETVAKSAAIVIESSAPVFKTEPKTKTEKVKIAVNCRHAVAYGVQDIPQNGIILDTEVSYHPGDTAMDALKLALKEQDISINESHGYVKGIAGLNEKECGGSSGWMYMVNSETPMISADKYALSPDDVITFYYVTSYGDRV